MKRIYCSLLVIMSFLLIVCTPKKKTETKSEPEEVKSQSSTVYFNQDSSNEFQLDVEQTGRYRINIYGEYIEENKVWIEDYIDNPDERTYNITGNINLSEKGVATVDGAPLARGKHHMKFHTEGAFNLDSISFELLIKHEETKNILQQNTEGDNWELVWSDEFNEKGLPDTNKWSYNIGNWGWGNNELQYYTANQSENAYQKDGNLIIKAQKNKYGGWTSARLTTQGKTSFLYGKIEFRAKVPEGRGTWAAGWLLGDAYKDEISWPYCGEIDVLESVGYEVNDTNGRGTNHASCHTRAYYFKQGNHISNTIEVDSMNTKFHTYTIEWYPDLIHAFLDGQRYYTYDKAETKEEWPFNNPQNIIINLAIGGGWGGKKGIDESYNYHQYIIDYIRVYEKQ